VSVMRLNVEQNVLTIQAERRHEPQEDDQLLVQERPRDTFSRQLFLSEALDADQIQASYDQGVLSLEMPVSEQAKPRGQRLAIGRTVRASVQGGAPQPPLRRPYLLAS
jgi:HSP20 family protein